jgi:hypothetical protein
MAVKVNQIRVCIREDGARRFVKMKKHRTGTDKRVYEEVIRIPLEDWTQIVEASPLAASPPEPGSFHGLCSQADLLRV